MAFAYDISTYRNTESGGLVATGNPLDVAIQGSGYFAVQTPLGIRYTRAGDFQIDAIGTLSTPEGYPVLDTSNQKITFPDNAVTVEIGEIGNITIDGTEFATIGVFKFENEQLLERLNGGLFKTEITPEPADGMRVAQGALEKSNVQPIMELTHMIEVSRAVANNAKYIETIYDLQRKAANTWAQQG